MLVLVTLFWGTTFTLVKDAIAQVDLFAFLGQRFTFSFLLLLPFCLRKRQGFTPDVLWKGAVLGLLLFGDMPSRLLDFCIPPLPIPPL